MKRFLVCFVCLILVIPSIAFAEIDLSGLNYDELVALKDKINIAIWNSVEWQEVTVPQGVYTVGEDIPAGHWTIRAENQKKVYVMWSDTLDDGGKDISFSGKIGEYARLYSGNHKDYESGSDKTEVDYDIKDGQFIIVEEGNAVFSPYSGKPSLGFK